MESATELKYLETPEAIAARLQSGIEGAVVEVNRTESALYISAVFEAPSYFKAYCQVRSVLFDGLDCVVYPDVHLLWAPDERSWALARIKDAVVDALPLRCADGTVLHHLVSVGARGVTLRIDIDLAGRFGHLGRADYAQVRDSWRHKIGMIDFSLPKGIAQVCIHVGDYEFDWSPQSADPMDDDYWDDSSPNPNWPSRTGNPSGSGRGNNPPRR